MGKLVKYSLIVALLFVVIWGWARFFVFVARQINPPTVNVILEDLSEQDTIEFCTSPHVLEVLKISPEKCLEHMNRLRELSQ